MTNDSDGLEHRLEERHGKRTWREKLRYQLRTFGVTFPFWGAMQRWVLSAVRTMKWALIVSGVALLVVSVLHVAGAVVYEALGYGTVGWYGLEPVGSSLLGVGELLVLIVGGGAAYAGGAPWRTVALLTLAYLLYSWRRQWYIDNAVKTLRECDEEEATGPVFFENAGEVFVYLNRGGERSAVRMLGLAGAVALLAGVAEVLMRFDLLQVGTVVSDPVFLTGGLTLVTAIRVVLVVSSFGVVYWVGRAVNEDALDRGLELPEAFGWRAAAVGAFAYVLVVSFLGPPAMAVDVAATVVVVLPGLVGVGYEVRRAAYERSSTPSVADIEDEVDADGEGDEQWNDVE
jgi:hypothetical protein